jgi:hypothetical protein
MWLEFHAAMRGMDTLGGGRPRKVTKLSRPEGTISLILEAGAAGRELDYIREIMRAHWQQEDAIAKIRAVNIKRRTPSPFDKGVCFRSECA